MKFQFKLMFLIFINICFYQLSFGQTDNYVLGTNAGANITTGSYNTFIGLSTGFSNTTGYNNSVVGYQAGYSLTSGYRHVFIGYQAGYNTTTAIRNVFIGENAGYSNVTGGRNVYIGESAGYSNVNGTYNIFIGRDAGKATTVSDNIFIGYQSGLNNTTGRYNCMTGGRSHSFTYSAGYHLTTGSYNTAFGMGALGDVSTGNHNTAMGYEAGGNIEYSNDCTFLGYRAGFDNNRVNQINAGERNTYIGKSTGYTNRTGSENVGMGANADFVLGTGGISTTVHNTVFIGTSASVAADGVTIIGHQTSASGLNAVAIGKESSVTAANSIAIGYQSNVTTENEVIIGNAAHASIGGYVNWTATSDGRFKTDIQENVIGLEFINKLRPVTYHFDSKKLLEHKGQTIPRDLGNAISKKNQIRYTGFIAQEVDSVAQVLNFDFSGVDKPNTENEKDYYGIRYAEFVVPLVKATQELSQKVDALKQENAIQKDLLVKYEAALENALIQLEALKNEKSVVNEN